MYPCRRRVSLGYISPRMTGNVDRRRTTGHLAQNNQSEATHKKYRALLQ
jgi:hypothetical protein